MPTTHKLRIGTWNVTITNIVEEEGEDYVTVDKDNKELEYIKGTATRGQWIDPDTKKPVLKVYKRVNGKPADKLQRTEATDKFKEVEFMETLDWAEKYCYAVENVPNDLLEILKAGKAVKIIYSPGNGYSSYYGFVRINPRNKNVEMILSKTQKSKRLEEINQISQSKKKAKEVTLQEGVSRVQVDELMEL
jgi:hypothetical protein